MWPTIWGIIAVVSLIVEGLTVGLVSIWFTAGALISLVLSLLGVSEIIQCIVFIIVSIFGLILFRNYWKKHMKNNITHTNIDGYIGKEVMVIEDIDNDTEKGVIKINGQLWTARAVNGEKIEKDSKVKIQRLEGNKVFVEKIK